MEPVHYEDEDGSWKEMDDTLEEVAFGRSIGGTGNRKFCNNKGKLAIQLMDSAEPAATASLTMQQLLLKLKKQKIILLHIRGFLKTRICSAECMAKDLKKTLFFTARKQSEKNTQCYTR